MTTAYRNSSNLKSTSAWLLGGVGVALAMLGAVPAMAMTTAELRAACQTSPGNVVALTQPVTILDGPRYPAAEQVLTGCTIVLGPNAKLAMEGVSMRFAGPLVVQSATLTEVLMARSFLSAPSVNFNLPGTGSVIDMAFSNVQATAAGLLITMGDESKLTVQDNHRPGPHEVLDAATTLQIRSGRKFTAQLSHMRLSAPQGIEIAMNGDEGVLTINTAWLTAAQGNIGLTASNSKAQVDLSSTNLVSNKMVTLRLAGSDSLLKLQQVGIGGVDGQIALGGLVIEIGSGAAENGMLEASNVGIVNVASINVRASVNGRNGVLKIQKSHLRPPGDLVLETGAQGLTEVVENYGGSSTRFRVATGTGGSCIAQNNDILAPIMQVCQ